MSPKDTTPDPQKDGTPPGQTPPGADDSLQFPEWMSRWHTHRDDFNGAAAKRKQEEETLRLAELQKKLTDTIFYNDMEAADALIADGAIASAAQLQRVVELGWTEWTKKMLEAKAVPTSAMVDTAVRKHTENAEMLNALLAAGAVPAEDTLTYAQEHNLGSIALALATAMHKDEKAAPAAATPAAEKAPAAPAEPPRAINPRQQRKLEDAVNSRNLGRAKRAIEKGGIPTDLMFSSALNNRHNEMALALIEGGLPPTSAALHEAVTFDNIPAAEALLVKGAKPLPRTVRWAKMHKNDMLAATLIKGGGSDAPESGDTDWNKFLIEEAAKAGNTAEIETIAALGGKATPKALEYAMTQHPDDEALMTALIAARGPLTKESIDDAARLGSLPWIVALAAAGVQPDNTTLHISYMRETSDLETGKFLVNAGVIPGSDDLLKVVKRHQTEWVKLFTDKDVTADGAMLNHAAISLNDIEIGKMLVDAGATPDPETLRHVFLRDAPEWQELLTPTLTEANPDAMADLLVKAFKSGPETTVDKVIAAGIVPGEAALWAALENGAEAMQKAIAGGGVPTEKMLRSAVEKQDDALIDAITGAGVVPNTDTLWQPVIAQNLALTEKLIAAGGKPIDEMVNRNVAKHDLADLLMKNMEDAPSERVLWSIISSQDADLMKKAIKAGATPPEPMLLHVVTNKIDALADAILDNTKVVPSEKTVWQAVVHNNPALTEKLIAAGGKPNDAMLVESIRGFGDSAMTDLLLEKIETPPSDKALWQVITAQDATLMEKAIAAGATPLEQMLQYAAKNGLEPIAHAILDKTDIVPTEQTLWVPILGGDTDLAGKMIAAGGKPTDAMLVNTIQSHNGDNTMTDLLIKSMEDAPSDKALWAIITTQDAALLKKAIKAGAPASDAMLQNVTQNGLTDMATVILENATLTPSEQTLWNIANNNEPALMKLAVAAGGKPTDGLLHFAVQSGYTAIADIFMEAGITPSTDTLWHMVEENNLKGMNSLIAAGGKPDIAMLKYVLEYGYTATADAILEAGVKPSADTLWLALESNDGKTFKKLVDADGEPDADMLHYTVENTYTKMMDIILADGVTPREDTMWLAVESNDTTTLRKLIDAHGKVNPDMLGYTVENSYGAATDILLAAGVVPNNDTLCAAIDGAQNMKVLKKLVDAATAVDSHMLRLAVETNHREAASLLMEAGALPDSNMLWSAIEHDSPGLLSDLLAHGAVADAEMLHDAVYSGYTSIADALIEAGVTPRTDTLAQAEANGDMPLFRKLQQAQKGLGSRAGKEAALSDAVHGNNIKGVEEALASGVKVNNELGGQLLRDSFNAATNPQIAADLIVAGAPLPPKDTPLPNTPEWQQFSDIVTRRAQKMHVTELKSLEKMIIKDYSLDKKKHYGGGYGGNFSKW